MVCTILPTAERKIGKTIGRAQLFFFVMIIISHVDGHSLSSGAIVSVKRNHRKKKEKKRSWNPTMIGSSSIPKHDGSFISSFSFVVISVSCLSQCSHVGGVRGGGEKKEIKK
jgi:hypothetical protein